MIFEIFVLFVELSFIIITCLKRNFSKKRLIFSCVLILFFFFFVCDASPQEVNAIFLHNVVSFVALFNVFFLLLSLSIVARLMDISR